MANEEQGVLSVRQSEDIMRLAYRQPSRRWYEKPVDQPLIMGPIYFVIDLPGKIYWTVREWLRSLTCRERGL